MREKAKEEGIDEKSGREKEKKGRAAVSPLEVTGTQGTQFFLSLFLSLSLSPSRVDSFSAEVPVVPAASLNLSPPGSLVSILSSSLRFLSHFPSFFSLVSFHERVTELQCDSKL